MALSDVLEKSYMLLPYNTMIRAKSADLTFEVIK